MILHIDMDAFFASVEQRDNPELRGQPVIIGGRSKRAVVSTASYEARAFGVHSAMPLFEARRLCPQGIVVRGRMSRYKEVSRSVFQILTGFSPVVEPVSIDEAYLDISGCEKVLGPPRTIAENIKQAIRAKESLSCSIGISPLKFLSKIASDMNKPDGITVIEEDDVMEVIENLPVHKVPGVGKRTRTVLEQLGVKTLGDVSRIPEKTLESRLGIYGRRLLKLSRGEDTSRVVPDDECKSISTENTLEADTLDREFLKTILLMQADEVARQLRRKKFKARTVTLKITFSDFRQRTRRHTLTSPVQSARDIFTEAHTLFCREDLYRKIRLIGLGAAGLVPENKPQQTLLFEKTHDATREKWEKAERAMDSILGKFGKNTMNRAIHTPSKDKDD